MIVSSEESESPTPRAKIAKKTYVWHSLCSLLFSWMLRAPSTPRAKGKGKAVRLLSPMVVSESDALTRSAKSAKGNDSSDERKKMYGWFSLYFVRFRFVFKAAHFFFFLVHTLILTKPLFVSYTGQLAISVPLSGVLASFLFLYFFSYNYLSASLQEPPSSSGQRAVSPTASETVYLEDM